MRASATNRLNIGISRILKGSSDGKAISSLKFDSIYTSAIKGASIMTALFGAVVFANNLFKLNSFNDGADYDGSLGSFSLTSFYSSTYYNNVFDQDNSLYNELFYAEPPSSFDLIEDMLTAQDQLIKNERQAQKGAYAKDQYKKGSFKSSIVQNSTLPISVKNPKEEIDLSGPNEPQVIYDSILYPQVAEFQERNPFDTEAPDTFF